MEQQQEGFGAAVRRRRMELGLSLAALAIKVNYSRGHLSKIETGSRSPSPQLAALIDTKLKADGALARLIGPTEAIRDDCYCDLPMTEHDPALLGDIDLPPELTAATAVNTEAIAKTFENHLVQVRSLGQHLSPSAVFPLLEGSLRSLRALLANTPAPDRSRLLVTASHYAEYTGWMAQESGNEQAALAWTDRAVQLARSSGRTEMAAYALVRRALVKLYHNDGHGTVGLARRAQAESPGSNRIQGLAAMREGQGHALNRDFDAFQECMARAEDLLADAPPDRSEPVFGTSTVAKPVRMAVGWSLYHLGRPAEGAAILADGLERLPRDAPRSYGRYAVRCALQYAVAGELDRACDVTAELLPRIVDVVSATILVDLRELTLQLDRHRSHRGVRTLMPELTSAVSRQSAMIGRISP